MSILVSANQPIAQSLNIATRGGAKKLTDRGSSDHLVQQISVHERDTGGAGSSADNCRVITRCSSGENGRLTVVDWSEASCGDVDLVWRVSPVVIAGDEFAKRIPNLQRWILQRPRNTICGQRRADCTHEQSLRTCTHDQTPDEHIIAVTHIGSSGQVCQLRVGGTI